MAPTAGGLAVGGDVEQALAGLPVPSYVLDTAGVVRWINPAAERLLGDVRGRHFTSVVGPEDRARAQELFARKVLGTTAATETSGVFVATDGTRVALEVSAVPLMGGERVVGVFGLLTGPLDEEASTPPAHLTPRQAEVLRLLEQGRSTKQIAQELHAEHGDGPEPRPPSAASPRREHAPRSRRRRPARSGLRGHRKLTTNPLASPTHL